MLLHCKDLEFSGIFVVSQAVNYHFKLFVTRFFLIFTAILVIFTKSFSQWNVKVGYAGIHPKSEPLRNGIRTFNQQFPDLDNALDDFVFLHGIELGARWSAQKASLEVGWLYGSDKSTVTGKNLNDKWWLSAVSYHALAELRPTSLIGIGGGMARWNVQMKTDIQSAPKKKKTVVSNAVWSPIVFISLHLPGESTGLCIRPYYQWNLDVINWDGFEDEIYALFGPEKKPNQTLAGDFTVFGISVIMFNGPQNN